jgi:hypothetical protein
VIAIALAPVYYVLVFVQVFCLAIPVIVYVVALNKATNKQVYVFFYF